MIRVLFISSGNSNAGISPIIKAQGESIILKGLTLHFFTIKRKGFYGYFSAVFSLRKFLRNNSFDILHAHYGLSAIVALFARKNEKIIVSFMGSDLVGSNWENGSITMASKIIVKINTWLANRFYDYNIVKSDEMLQRLKNSRVSLLPNGVDLNVFQPDNKINARRKLNWIIDDKIIIFVSDPARVEKNFRLAKDAVEETNISGIKLFVVNGINHSELVHYYNAADMLVLSSFHEGSPNVVKEAMSCNCPVVSTDVGDVRWVFGDVPGCFISSGDKIDFCEQIKKALKFVSDHEKTIGRTRIIALGLDDAGIASRIIEIYNSVLNKPIRCNH